MHDDNKKGLIPGTNISDEEKVAKAKLVCELYSTNQYTLESCLQQVGIASDSTWYLWIKQIEEIKDLYHEAKQRKKKAYKSQMVEIAKTQLQRYLEGFTIEVTERVAEVAEGNQLVTKSIKQKEIYIKPSIRAIEFVLLNFTPELYTRNPIPQTVDDTPEKLTIEIKGQTIQPITSENDIIDPTN